MSGVIELDTSKGVTVLIDSDDYERVVKWSWHFDGRYVRGYPNGVKEYLHRYIMKPKLDQVVDHINGNRLDCRRSNMRNCTRSINASNQHGKIRNRHGIRGIYQVAGKNIFRAEIYYNKKRYALGSFASIEAAGKEYKKAKRLLHAGKVIA